MLGDAHPRGFRDTTEMTPELSDYLLPLTLAILAILLALCVAVFWIARTVRSLVDGTGTVHLDVAQASADASQVSADASQVSADESQVSADASQVSADASQAAADASQVHADESQADADTSQLSADVKHALYSRAVHHYIEIVAHRILNPVAAIKGAAMTLQNDKVQDRENLHKNLLAMIVEQCDRLEEVTLDPQRILSIEEQPLHPLPEPNELVEVEVPCPGVIRHEEGPPQEHGQHSHA